jgi:hypothetical protein
MEQRGEKLVGGAVAGGTALAPIPSRAVRVRYSVYAPLGTALRLQLVEHSPEQAT